HADRNRADTHLGRRMAGHDDHGTAGFATLESEIAAYRNAVAQPCPQAEYAGGPQTGCRPQPAERVSEIVDEAQGPVGKGLAGLVEAQAGRIRADIGESAAGQGGHATAFESDAGIADYQAEPALLYAYRDAGRDHAGGHIASGHQDFIA